MTYVVTEEKYQALREIAQEFGIQVPKERDELKLFGYRFIVGEKPEVRTEPHNEDLEEIAAVVKNASRLSDYTIVTIHAHEGDRSRFVPAKFLIVFARAMIDAGADVFVGHGPHVLRGIEIYKGKPIFYSLGDFMFQNETLLRLPYENYESLHLGSDAHVADFNDARYDNDRKGFPATPEIWESVIAVPGWKGGKLHEIKLYPISLGHGKPRTVRGRPLLADPELGKKIIEDLKRLSGPLGTTIDYKDGIGIINISKQTEKK